MAYKLMDWKSEGIVLESRGMDFETMEVVLDLKREG